MMFLDLTLVWTFTYTTIVFHYLYSVNYMKYPRANCRKALGERIFFSNWKPNVNVLSTLSHVAPMFCVLNAFSVWDIFNFSWVCLDGTSSVVEEHLYTQRATDQGLNKSHLSSPMQDFIMGTVESTREKVWNGMSREDSRQRQHTPGSLEGMHMYPKDIEGSNNSALRLCTSEKQNISDKDGKFIGSRHKRISLSKY